MAEPADASLPPAIAPLQPVAARLLRRAEQEVQRGDTDAATRSIASALALAGDHPEALRRAGGVAQGCGDQTRAVDLYRRALAMVPDDTDAHTGLGSALYRLGQETEGLEHLHRACELAPESAAVWYNLAEALKPLVQTQEAIAALDRALSLDPSHLAARLSLARAQTSQGLINEAATNLREILRRDPGHDRAWSDLANLKTVRFDGEDMRRLARALAQANLAEDARARLEFTLARALEDQGNYVRSFEVLQRANARQHVRLKWDAAGERKRVQAILEAFGKPVAQAPDPELGREVIFIASAPRSGSSLVEQILASHPDVEGANEIKDLSMIVNAETRARGSFFPLWIPEADADDWQRLGAEYVAKTARWHAGKPRFTDKNLLNWMLAGTALAMLPAARVVVVRRDPVETCLACYRQMFAQGAEFSNDLDEMADFYIDFWHLTRFWLEKYPGSVFELEYESLLADPEGTIRRLLEFCRLPFDPACLDFHRTQRTVLSAPSAAQVRQPLQRDTARAARYGHLLDGLRERLRVGGVPAG